MTRAYKITLAFDGTAYAGWQRQLNQPTVQGVLEAALERICGERVPVAGSSRTDSGVHALGIVARFESDKNLTPADWHRALNAFLPRDVVVHRVEPIHIEFDPTSDAVCKRYRYVLYDGKLRELFRRNFCWQIFSPLDVDAMQRAAQALRGKHDFRSFETHGPNRVTSVRTIFDIQVHRQGGENADFIHLEVEGDGFLYNMVRAITGTLVEVGKGKQGEQWPGEVLAAQDRSVAGMTAPPQGLFLLWVRYPPEMPTGF